MSIPKSNTLILLPNGIQSIALSFSGGGFRAAGFTLGCAAYLNNLKYGGKPMLERVKFISSASGGSITNLVLSHKLRQGHSFNEIYRDLISKMEGTSLMDKVVSVLNNDEAWKDRPEKSRNLINAFSMVYDQLLFEGGMFESLLNPASGSQFVIEEVSVNTTEFNNGLNFRFGNRGRIGNQFLHIKKSELTTAGKIKLGDILACSSCFPAGFEPVVFPADFTWKNKSEELSSNMLFSIVNVKDQYYSGQEEKTKEMDGGDDEEDDDKDKDRNKDKNKKGKVLKAPFGIMDGGIDDNQGIYSFMLADDRKKAQDYDLYLPCDVSSNYLDKPFQYPAASANILLSRKPEELKRTVKNYVIGYLVVSFALLLIACQVIFANGNAHIGYGLLGASIALLLMAALLFVFVKPKISRLINAIKTAAFPGQGGGGTWSVVFKKYNNALFDRSLGQLVLWAVARLDSVLLLADSIYLKRIRQLSYNNLYAAKASKLYKEAIKKHNDGVQTGGVAAGRQISVGRLWNDHIGATTVYLLSSKNRPVLISDIKGEPWDYDTATVSKTDMQLLKDLLTPTETLTTVVDVAANMETTLWFDDNHMKKNALRCLVVAGQATMCYTMLLISFRFANTDKNWLDMREQLIKDWKQFCEKPVFLF